MVPEKRGVTPEKAISLLKKNGTEVSLEEATEILALFYFLAELAVKQHEKSSQPKRKSNAGS